MVWTKVAFSAASTHRTSLQKLSPILVSFVFGLFTLFGLAWLAHELFNNRQITSLTALLGAMLPQRVVLGLVPLSEIMFIGMIVVGSAFLVRWIRDQRLGSLA